MKKMLCLALLIPLGIPAPSAADLLVDHVEYIRRADAPQSHAISFPACDPAGAFTLTVGNGQDDQHRANTGSVSVNGAPIIGPEDFAGRPAVIARPLPNLTAGNQIAMTVSGAAGNVVSFRVTAETTCPEITILSPLPGAVVNRGKITVSGKVRHRTPEIGVVVNGVLAEVNGNDWAANRVELATGENTLTIAAYHEDGTTAETAITVTRPDSNVSEIEIYPLIASGTAPLTASVMIQNYVRANIVSFRVDYEGDGTFDLEAPTLESFEHVYPQEGLFPATVVARDDQGVEYISSFTVNVHPLPPLKSKWEKMKVSLAAGDIEAAIRDFRDQEKQRVIFTEIARLAAEDPQMPSLPALAARMEGLEFVDLVVDTAEFWISREETVEDAPLSVSYPVYFTKRYDFFWQLERF